MSGNVKELNRHSLTKLVSLVYWRLNYSKNLPKDWEEEAFCMLDDMREEVLEWLEASHKAMQREGNRVKREKYAKGKGG